MILIHYNNTQQTAPHQKNFSVPSPSCTHARGADGRPTHHTTTKQFQKCSITFYTSYPATIVIMRPGVCVFVIRSPHTNKKLCKSGYNTQIYCARYSLMLSHQRSKKFFSFRRLSTRKNQMKLFCFLRYNSDLDIEIFE